MRGPNKKNYPGTLCSVALVVAYNNSIWSVPECFGEQFFFCCCELFLIDKMESCKICPTPKKKFKSISIYTFCSFLNSQSPIQKVECKKPVCVVQSQTLIVSTDWKHIPRKEKKKTHYQNRKVTVFFFQPFVLSELKQTKQKKQKTNNEDYHYCVDKIGLCGGMNTQKQISVTCNHQTESKLQVTNLVSGAFYFIFFKLIE
ncbi:hypothetical protein RFI_14295 [Reticulomyxa filosa]|uniref:Uncharacterized protein n=1 Tax=Reticulomyxa filosa TaxID=46433 RepID=X6NAX9_RETFI|nr:hypothetical protein RFI_14295 [Reticulomyxa filosa]|eukprot:ETO22899.1 hypothetical protein RFI_14295 [Reticulomyxa filosa]